jgi:DNA-binding response OmpR family regulator
MRALHRTGMVRSVHHILVVDDEPDFAALIAQALSDEFEVVVALDVPSGLAAVDARRPALILLDLRMPGHAADGFDFLTRYRSRVGEALAPVVITSALPMRDQAVLQDRVAAFLPKPFEIEAMRALVRRVALPSP